MNRKAKFLAGGLVILAALLLVALGAFLLWTPDRTPAYLEARYLAAPEDLIDVPVAGTKLRLHVRDDGPRDAPALLFLHGFFQVVLS